METVGGEGKKEREQEEKQVPQSYRAGASKDSEGGRRRRSGAEWGVRGGEREGERPLVKLSTDA